MFTTSQFSQLAAATWSASAFSVSCSQQHQPGQATSATIYTITYCRSGLTYAECYSYTGQGATPFEAVADAIEQVWAAGAIKYPAYCEALTTIEQAEQAAACYA